MKLKFALLSVVSILALQSPVFAEDYYVPVRKELEPLSRLPLSEFNMSDEKITYVLPQDLTGRPIRLDLPRDLSHGEAAFPRLYKGSNATASCMGVNSLPACVITHNDLGLNKDEVNKFLDSKYKDPTKLKNAREVAGFFSSGNEPIGFISKRANLPKKDFPLVWNAQFLIKGAQGTFTQGLNGILNLGEADQQSFLFNGNNVKVSNLVKHGLNASGYINTGMKVWFDVTLNTDKNAFEGTWGEVHDGKHMEASGIVNGTEKK